MARPPPLEARTAELDRHRRSARRRDRAAAGRECAPQRARRSFLLKVIEREQARNAELAAEHAALETDRGAIFRDLRAALEAELRPVLLVMLHLIEKQRADPAGEGAAASGARRHARQCQRRRPTTPMGSSTSMRNAL